jgi:S-adenosylmethionine-diacylgycerolhomoserine-N-methlytransferase
MAPSTSHASLRPERRTEDRFAVAALGRFYRRQAWLYDWTRPFFLFGRERLLAGLEVTPGDLVLDVGCGTGFCLPRLASRGAEVVGIELSDAMRARAESRVARAGCRRAVRFDAQPYGSHAAYTGRAHHVLFSYSLTMIPPFQVVLQRARADLRSGGTIAVVDFLDASNPVINAWLRASHVSLGLERLAALQRMFPAHRLRICSVGPWRYYLFWGDVPSQGAKTSH